MVGEQALREGRQGRRSASVRALTEVTLLAVPADALFCPPEFVSLAAAFKALGVEQTGRSCLQRPEGSAGGGAFALGTVQTFEAGALIFSAQAEDDAFYLVERGEVGLYEASGSSRGVFDPGGGHGLWRPRGAGPRAGGGQRPSGKPRGRLCIRAGGLTGPLRGGGGFETLAEFQERVGYASAGLSPVALWR